METKHTKGPWLHSVQSNGPNESKIGIRTNNEQYILRGKSDFNFETTVANAKLISFSPEMLEVLQAVQASKSYNKTDLALMYNLVDQTLKKIIG